MSDESKIPKSKRRWLRFNLRTSLIFVVILSLLLACTSIVYRAERQKHAVKWVKINQGFVYYEFEVDSAGKTIDDGQPPGPQWLRDILGVDYFSNVVCVDLKQGDVVEVEPLSALRSLEYLDIWSVGDVDDLTPLSGSTNLKELRIIISSVSDVTPLGNLTKLRFLSLNSSHVNDLTPLTSLTKLEQLHLSSTKVSDLTPLGSMVNLEGLNLKFTGIIDVKPLASLKQLRGLSLSHTQVHDVTPLSSLTNLEELYLTETEVTDLKPLANLTKLKYLDLQWTKVGDAEIEKLKQTLPNCYIQQGD